MSTISPHLQAALTRALTNSRRTQKESGKDVLSRTDAQRILHAAAADGITADEAKLIVDQVAAAIHTDKLELDTARRRNAVDKLFATLAQHQPAAVAQAAGGKPAGAMGWLDLVIAEKTDPARPVASLDVDVQQGIAAYERIANILVQSRERPADGSAAVVDFARALALADERQRPAVEAFHQDLVAEGVPLTWEAVTGWLDNEIASLRGLDADHDQLLSVDERLGLDAVGHLAVDLAQALAAQDPVPAAAAHVFGDATGPALQAKIRSLVQETHRELDYSYARTVLFSQLHNAAGQVKDVYTDRTIETSGTPRRMTEQQMNTEHVFPKARGVGDIAALSDLHHLLPADVETNGKRGNHPFGVVVGTPVFEKGGSKLGYDRDGGLVFEPPEDIKGAIARALMYVHTVYKLDIDDVGGKALLQQWNADHPPTAEEVARNAAISKHQGNRNPFVDHPGLVDRV